MDPNEPTNLSSRSSADNSTPDHSPGAVVTPTSGAADNAMSVVTPSGQSLVSPKTTLNPKNLFQQWQFWGMVAMGFIAIAGIIFGVYGFNSDAEQRERADQLQAELNEANELLVKYGTQLGIKVNEYGRPIGETDNDDKKDEPTEVKIASSDYIYIGEWGIKLKIPEGLTKVSYVFNGAERQGITSVAVTGLPEDLADYPDEAGAMPSFADMRNHPESNFGGLGILARVPKEKDDSGKLACPAAEGGSPGELVHSDKQYCFLYSHPQAVFSTDEAEQAAELKAVDLIQELLTKNITTF